MREQGLRVSNHTIAMKGLVQGELHLHPFVAARPGWITHHVLIRLHVQFAIERLL